MMYRIQNLGTIEETIAPAFTLPSLDGSLVSLSAFRQRQPVALLFIQQLPHLPLALAGISELRGRFAETRVAAIIVVRQLVETTSAFAQIVLDRDGQVFERYECLVGSAICLFGLDRYGAVVYRAECEPQDLNPALRTLLDAIEFSEMQCPECGV